MTTRADRLAVLATDCVYDRWVHTELPTGAYRCPGCEGSSPPPGSPNVCACCLGNHVVGGALARVYALGALEVVKAWMRDWVR